MIDTLEELVEAKYCYARHKSLHQLKSLEYVVYKVTKSEYRGVNRWFVQLKTNATKTSLKKTLNMVGYTMYGYGYLFYNTLDELKADVCRELKQKPDINKKLFKKMMSAFPEYFV